MPNEPPDRKSAATEPRGQARKAILSASRRQSPAVSRGPDILTREENCGARLKNGGGQNRSKAEIAQLTVSKYLGNARATGGPGILPETNWDHWVSRMNTSEPHIPDTGQDV